MSNEMATATATPAIAGDLAIIAPGVLTRDHEVVIGWGNHQMWAVIAAAAVFARTRNMTAMMVVGMGLFTVLRLFA